MIVSNKNLTPAQRLAENSSDPNAPQTVSEMSPADMMIEAGAVPPWLEKLSDDLTENEYRAAVTLKRIWPRLGEFWMQQQLAAVGDASRIELKERYRDFSIRLQRFWTPLFEKLYQLYGQRYDFHYHVETMLVSASSALIGRAESLCAIDRIREVKPDWFQSEKIVGGALYVDLFSENLDNLRQHIAYFKDLGITYLHLMPLFAVPDGNSDGGYAISDYRAVDPRLGTIEDLKKLSEALRAEGIFLVLDFVFNHTSSDHLWAKQAQSGNAEYQEFYFIFPDRTEPDQYEQNLREIFPTVRRGNFTWHDGMGKWVWTTFNSFQWDLNYQNPSVFRSMMEEMLFIANLGIDALRLDAVAFIWKEKGTGCENLDEAHLIIQAYNLFVRIAAPGLVFKSEAIVHPDDVVKYIDPHECQLSYNPMLMALLWESLATRKVTLLNKALQHRYSTPEQTSWVNYLRCHDDIGWTFDDNDAASVGINAYDHRNFLNRFYTGQFPESFARGVPFQENVETGDMRVSGTLASLAGLEAAIVAGDLQQTELAVARILLLQGVSMSIGGIPLLYLGEEWGMLNDYDFVNDRSKADDSRWIHRPKMDWSFIDELIPTGEVSSVDSPLIEPSKIKNATAEFSAENRTRAIQVQIFKAMQRLISLRKTHAALAGQDMELFETGNMHLLGFVRIHEGHRMIVLANFSEREQIVEGNRLRMAGLGRFFRDLISDVEVKTSEKLKIKPYQLLWLIRE